MPIFFVVSAPGSLREQERNESGFIRQMDCAFSDKGPLGYKRASLFVTYNKINLPTNRPAQLQQVLKSCRTHATVTQEKSEFENPPLQMLIVLPMEEN